MQTLAQSYLNALQKADYGQLIQLFADNAVVRSPLYGERPAAAFYQALLADTQQSELTLLDTFADPTGRKIAIHFLYRWTLANDSIAVFDVVDLFELDDTGKIKSLKIIYDTAQTRSQFERMKC